MYLLAIVPSRDNWIRFKDVNTLKNNLFITVYCLSVNQRERERERETGRTIKHHHTLSVCATYIMEPICLLWSCRWGLITKLPALSFSPSSPRTKGRGTHEKHCKHPSLCVTRFFFFYLDNRARDTAFSRGSFAFRWYRDSGNNAFPMSYNNIHSRSACIRRSYVQPPVGLIPHFPTFLINLLIGLYN